MAFKVKIKNIGKLEDAEVGIGQFTVFAGPNNTGKSFVSKLLYSLFNAMNANHVETHLNNLFKPVYEYLMMPMKLELVGRPDKAAISWQSSLENEIKKLEALVKEASHKEFESENIILEVIIPGLISHIEKIERIAADIPRYFEKKRTEGIPNYLPKYLEILTNGLAELKETLQQTKAEDFIVDGIRYELSQNLIQNFQVPNVSDLIKKEGTPSEVVVEDFGKFVFLDEGVGFEIDRSWVKQLQQYSRVIYLESPVYWKLKTALENIQDSPVYLGDRERLSGVPGYFYDLASALKYEYTGDMAFPDVYAKLTGKNVMEGKIAISETGNLSFHACHRYGNCQPRHPGIAN
ncbi:MAG: AAA family ATPase [Candidatus Latescibacteria bacterium]|nr:AAA family ATPase [Candidatus Latescibacterota bacterium]